MNIPKVPDEPTWQEYELKRQGEVIDEILKIIQHHNIQIDRLNQRAGIWGVVGGFISGITTSFLKGYTE